MIRSHKSRCDVISQVEMDSQTRLPLRTSVISDIDRRMKNGAKGKGKINNTDARFRP